MHTLLTLAAMCAKLGIFLLQPIHLPGECGHALLQHPSGTVILELKAPPSNPRRNRA